MTCTRRTFPTRSPRASPSRPRSCRATRGLKSTRSHPTTRRLTGPTRPTRSFNVQHALDRAQRLHHALEVFDVADFNGDVDPRPAVVVRMGFHVADVGVDVGDLGADGGEEPLPVFD